MAEEKVGIKETLEIFNAIPKFTEVLYKNLNDGVQLEDAINIASGMLAAEIVSGFSNAGQVPRELKDIDLQEARELTQAGVNAIFDTLKVFRGSEELPGDEQTL